MSNISENYENFIKNITRIVQLRDDQFEELMTTGVYYYDDPETREVHTVVRDPTTLYVAPSYNFKWLVEKVYNAMVQPFEPTPGAVILNDMRETVNRTLEEIEDFDSYVGMRGLMRNGDYIKQSEYYKFYVNGTLYETDYVCQNRSEYVFVLFLAKDRAMTLKYDQVHFFPNELYVVRNGYQVSVENRICSAATYVYSNVEESCLPDLRSCKILEFDTNETTSSNISPILEELYFYGRTINNNRFSGCSFLRKAYLPYVTTVGTCTFNNCTNLELVFTRLITQANSVNDDCFSGIKSLTLPKSFINQGTDRFIGNVNTLFLNCINANFTRSLSYNRNANVKHIVLAKNWNANLYLHNFTNLDTDEMIEIFNQLPDLTGKTTKTITLYSAFYDDLWNTLVIYDDVEKKYRKITDEEAEDDDIILYAINAVDIVLNKEWTVTKQ